jgi:hypothetical protein
MTLLIIKKNQLDTLKSIHLIFFDVSILPSHVQPFEPPVKALQEFFDVFEF